LTDVGGILDGINRVLDLLSDPDKGVRELIRLAFKGVTPRDVASAINSDVDPLTLTLKTYNLSLDSLRVILRPYLRANWNTVTKYITKPTLVRDLIVSERPDLKKILYTQQGLTYITRQLKKIARILYDIAWR